MTDFIKDISNDDLIQMCNEIWEWKNTGLLNQEGKFKTLYNEHKKDFEIIMYLEEQVMFETHNRFRNVVKLLFTHNAGLYVR